MVPAISNVRVFRTGTLAFAQFTARVVPTEIVVLSVRAAPVKLPPVQFIVPVPARVPVPVPFSVPPVASSNEFGLLSMVVPLICKKPALNNSPVPVTIEPPFREVVVPATLSNNFPPLAAQGVIVIATALNLLSVSTIIGNSSTAIAALLGGNGASLKTDLNVEGGLTQASVVSIVVVWWGWNLLSSATGWKRSRSAVIGDEMARLC